eukprot:TRINITY_DN10763_c0_g1_i3.p1 TRINITY_DN10763_c0_g1~~TRINITY_DN10763_c0_g1_i3.p1  ORF type:complete len:607 (+),score=169.40 TRINITY_DN10763_c0_g1_i3:35-1855(+)
MSSSQAHGSHNVLKMDVSGLIVRKYGSWLKGLHIFSDKKVRLYVAVAITAPAAGWLVHRDHDEMRALVDALSLEVRKYPEFKNTHYMTPSLPDFPKSIKKMKAGVIEAFQSFFDAINQLLQMQPEMAAHPALQAFVRYQGRYPQGNFVSEGVLHNGELRKKMNISKRMEITPYCIIKDRALYYFKSVRYINPIACIELDDYTVEAAGAGTIDPEDPGATSPPSSSSGSSSSFPFVLKLNGKSKYYFKSSTESDRARWLQAIAEANQAYKAACTPVTGTLKVQLIEGARLASKDIGGKSDPFAIINVEGQSSQTPTIKANLNPRWDHTEQFHITKHSGALRVLLWDQDRFTAADFMGKVVIFLASLPNGVPVDLWVPLAPQVPTNVITGEIHMVVTYTWDTAEHASRHIFGNHLSSVMLPDGTIALPKVIDDAITIITEHGLCEEGLFRIPPSTHELEKVRKEAEKGDIKDLLAAANGNVHLVASLLKLWLRLLPDPLVPLDAFDAFVALGEKKNRRGDEIDVDKLRPLVQGLPSANRQVMARLIPLLDTVQQHASINLMTARNLAVVFGPSCMRAPVEADGLNHITTVNELVATLILNHRTLLPST